MLGDFFAKNQKTGEVLHIIVVAIGMIITAVIAAKITKLGCGKHYCCAGTKTRLLSLKLFQSKRFLIGRK